MIKNTLQDESGNPESVKKHSQQFERFWTNVSIDGEDLLRVFYRLFYLQFCDSSDQWSNTVFCLKQVALYFKFMPNSTDFYKGIFLHVIAVRMIVPWLYALPSLQVVKKAKTFLSYVKHLWILVGERKCRILTGLYKWAFLNYPTIFLDWHNKTKLVPASFSCFQGFWWKQ